MTLLEVKALKKTYTTRLGGHLVPALTNVTFSVEKGEQDGRTFTRVVQLDRAQRQQELARLTGGASISATMLESAGELLDQADKFKKTLA